MQPANNRQKGGHPMQATATKTWETPSLTVYGNAADLTLVKNKHVGVSDGFTFDGTPISG